MRFINVLLNILLIIYLHFLNGIMSHWQLLNNWLVNDVIKYENTIIKHYRYAQKQNIYSCIYKLLNASYCWNNVL